MFEDDDYEDEMCECEIDWNCGKHGYSETPEDIIATNWSKDNNPF